MIDDVRKYMEATLEKLTPAKAQEMARALMKGQGREQVTKAAQDLLEWSHKSRERRKELVQREVKAQLKGLGVATRDEVEALRKRVRELERGGAAKRTAAKKSSAKRTAAKGTAAKRTAAKGSAA
jgi:polyhydroxyalkanoate synthesis regulator phasin